MPTRCVLGGCSVAYKPSAGQKVSLHTWPKDQKVRKKWDKFVKETRKDWIAGNDKSVLCNSHFTSEDFEGYLQWSMGFKRKLELKPGAVPTIKPAKSSNIPSACASPTDHNAGPRGQPVGLPSERETSKSRAAKRRLATTKLNFQRECDVKPECQVMYVVRHVACQTDPPPDSPVTRSVGTQLTRKHHYRSTASQVKPMGRDCGVCTEPLDSPMLFLQPILVKRPSKRRRDSQEDVGEGTSEHVTASTAPRDKNSSV
ncbi:THAP domain-containing protein 10 isoform X1 [Fundulus heteroclitus]|uniref:THAP domain-containing protein 10 isoform X1 n=1 Tax=Fundulus heteroclitus TaxID=8078 RepID=UPI00165B01AE|nr:THAP domain-containing protein 10 isoform X1 [Fundulus heteroclitus]